MENVNGFETISPGNFGKMLKLNSETLRKYALEIEKAGYVFMKSDGGHRRYTQADFPVFNFFLSMADQDGIALEAAAKIAVEKTKSAKLITNLPGTDEKSLQVQPIFKESGGELVPAELLERFEPVISEITKRLDAAAALREQESQRQMREYLDKKFEDRNKLVTDTLVEMRESRLAMQAQLQAQNEAAAAAAEKQTFIQKLFGIKKKKA